MPLFATMPTGYPCTRANPVINVLPYNFLNSSNFEPSTTRAMTLYLRESYPLCGREGARGAHVQRRLGVGRHDGVHVIRGKLRLFRRSDCDGALLLPIEILDDVARYGQRVLVVVGKVVSDA